MLATMGYVYIYAVGLIKLKAKIRSVCTVHKLATLCFNGTLPCVDFEYFTTSDVSYNIHVQSVTFMQLVAGGRVGTGVRPQLSDPARVDIRSHKSNA